MATKFITVSVEILHDKKLTPNEKFILAEIEQLTSLKDGCYASNQHFADLIGIPRQSASRTIQSLEKKGYITGSIKMGTRNRERVIKMCTPCHQNVPDVATKCLETKENRHINKQMNRQEETFPLLNKEAFKMWCDYKGSKYTKQGKTLSANKLSKFTHIQQQEMVDASIMNGYKGLFEPKVNPVKEKTPLKLKSFMDMKEYLTNNLEAIRHIDITYSNQLWKIGKGGIPYSKERIDDMPFDERKGFWLWLLNNKDILKVSA